MWRSSDTTSILEKISSKLEISDPVFMIDNLFARKAVRRNSLTVAVSATLSAIGLLVSSSPAATASGGASAQPLKAPQLIASSLAPDSAVYPPGMAEGSGVWVNLWNYPKDDVEGYCEKLYSNGIRNLFVQTSRSTTEAITQPADLSRLIETCHKYKIRVVAWSFAELKNWTADADKMIVAARFRTPSGDRLDGIAPNLEQNLNKVVVEAYSKRIREALGNGYPMMAVVYSPLNRAPMVALTPWKVLGKYYDVIAPMAYWNGKYQTIDAYTYTKRTVEKVRQLTEKPDVEVHVIGDGMGTRANEITEFIRACRDVGAQSASLYPNQRTTEEQFGAMARYSDLMPANGRRRLEVLRTMLSHGVVANPPTFDPSRPLSRGEFMKVVAHGLKVNVNDNLEAFNYFKRLGVVDVVAAEFPEMAADDDLISPITVEAGQKFVVTAKKAVASHAHAAKAGKKAPVARGSSSAGYLAVNRPTRVDRLFAAPVFAAGERQSDKLEVKASGKLHHINYLDAAHIFDDLSH